MQIAVNTCEFFVWSSGFDWIWLKVWLNIEKIETSYKGYKNTLYEGGTLSPAFLYSTKNKFARTRVNNLVHIVDWFPTILDFAGISPKNYDNLDGVSQKPVLINRYPGKVRKGFMYGLVNDFDIETEIWLSRYVVRLGNYKPSFKTLIF